MYCDTVENFGIRVGWSKGQAAWRLRGNVQTEEQHVPADII